METDQKIKTVTAHQEASKKLGRAIKESGAYKMFEEANRRLQGDDEARQLLREYQQEQQQVQMLQSWGGAGQDDLDRVEKMRIMMTGNPTLKELFRAQDELVTQLKEVNRLMTEKLGFDFADMTKPAGGCC